MTCVGPSTEAGLWRCVDEMPFLKVLTQRPRRLKERRKQEPGYWPRCLMVLISILWEYVKGLTVEKQVKWLIKEGLFFIWRPSIGRIPSGAKAPLFLFRPYRGLKPAATPNNRQQQKP
jgi:hypothetical protein